MSSENCNSTTSEEVSQQIIEIINNLYAQGVDPAVISSSLRITIESVKKVTTQLLFKPAAFQELVSTFRINSKKYRCTLTDKLMSSPVMIEGRFYDQLVVEAFISSRNPSVINVSSEAIVPCAALSNEIKAFSRTTLKQFAPALIQDSISESFALLEAECLSVLSPTEDLDIYTITLGSARPSPFLMILRHLKSLLTIPNLMSLLTFVAEDDNLRSQTIVMVRELLPMLSTPEGTNVLKFYYHQCLNRLKEESQKECFESLLHLWIAQEDARTSDFLRFKENIEESLKSFASNLNQPQHFAMVAQANDDDLKIEITQLKAELNNIKLTLNQMTEEWNHQTELLSAQLASKNSQQEMQATFQIEIAQLQAQQLAFNTKSETLRNQLASDQLLQLADRQMLLDLMSNYEALTQQISLIQNTFERILQDPNKTDVLRSVILPPPLPNSFQIFVKTKWSTIALDVYETFTVMKIKDAIQEIEQVNRSNQLLFFEGKQLSDSTTLAECQIIKGSMLHVRLKFGK